MAKKKSIRRSMKAGDVFNPYGLFLGVWVPIALLLLEAICPSAKLLYGLLAWHAGKDGRCFPSQATLAKELGISERHVGNLLRELEEERLIRIVQRGLRRTNWYEFLWHPALESCLKTPEKKHGASLKRKRVSTQDRKHSADKEKELEEKDLEEKLYDCVDRSVSAKRLRAKSASAGITHPSEEALSEFLANRQDVKLFENAIAPIREVLFECFGKRLGRPDRDICERILNAGIGAEPEKICSVVRRYAKRVSEGKKEAPRSYGFFVAHVGSFFQGHPPGRKFGRRSSNPPRRFQHQQDTEEGIEF